MLLRDNFIRSLIMDLGFLTFGMLSSNHSKLCSDEGPTLQTSALSNSYNDENLFINSTSNFYLLADALNIFLKKYLLKV